MALAKQTFDAIVFSGGGFKGAYGAGAFKGLTDYYKLKNIDRPLCFVGNSAGALNAAVAATSSVDELIKFWLTTTRKEVLGRSKPGLRLFIRRYAWWALTTRKKAFSICPEEPRRALIGRAAAFDKIRANSRHLIVVATDFVYAEARAFFVSALVDQMKAADVKRALDDQRLKHCVPISSQKELVEALLGSTAIPLVFPPVEFQYQRQGKLTQSTLVDGGVGNNTPTREAAYFLRNLEDLGLGLAGDTYCIKLSPARIVADTLKCDPLSILLRAYDVYDNIHMGRIVSSWHRINREIDSSEGHQRDFNIYLAKVVADDILRDQLSGEVQRFTPRQRKLGLIEIEPSQSLGDTLDFSEEQIRTNIKMGYDDAVKVLQNKGKITRLEMETLINGFPLPKIS
jgi:hypothetical protein